MAAKTETSKKSKKKNLNTREKPHIYYCHRHFTSTHKFIYTEMSCSKPVQSEPLPQDGEQSPSGSLFCFHQRKFNSFSSFLRSYAIFFIVTYTQTDTHTILHSTSIQGGFSHISEGDKGKATFFPMHVKTYVASLFNIIALKTTGGQCAFFEPASTQENIYHMIAHMQTLPAH